MTILELSVTVFITQLIFVGFRTWNVLAIAEKNVMKTAVSGTLCHITWLASIAIGSVSTYEIINNGDMSHLPVVLLSVAGGTLGSVIGLTLVNIYQQRKNQTKDAKQD